MDNTPTKRKVKSNLFSTKMSDRTGNFKQKYTSTATEILYAHDKQMPSVSTIPVTIPSQTTVDNTVSKPINIFALNGDCLRKICNYCSIADLYNMSIASDKLEMQIVRNAVRGRTIKFSEVADSCHVLDVFKMFGSNITKMDIGEKDIQYKERKYSKIDEILRLISTYCAMDTIKHLTLQYYPGTTIKKRFLYASLPLFRCIESLTVKEADEHSMEDCINYFESNCEYNLAIDNLVERMVSTAVNITSLELHHLKISGRFFYLHHIHNLKKLTLAGCNVKVPEAFLSFLRGQPKLKSLTWSNSSLRGMDTNRSHSSNLVYELVAESITELETFQYYPNEGYINDNNKYDSEFLFKLPDYEHLAKFRNLKVLSIPGVTIGCLHVLAKQNTVEKLLTCFSQANNRNNAANDFKCLQNFNSLKCIQLFTSFDNRAKIFNKNLLSNTHHLTECYLDFFDIEEDLIITAIKSARNLSKLHISLRRGKFTIAMYSKLREVKIQHGAITTPLTIYVEKRMVKQLLARLEMNYRPDIITVRESV